MKFDTICKIVVAVCCVMVLSACGFGTAFTNSGLKAASAETDVYFPIKRGKQCQKT